MTKPELYARVADGDKDAEYFLNAVDQLFEAIAKFIADKKTDPHEFIALMAHTNRVFSLPFYARNAPSLHVAVTKLLSGLADTASPTSLSLDVAFLKLGFSGTRKLILELKASVLAKEAKAE